jgi:competence ComEA-like helix-hairpin-helix protein
MKAKGKYQKAKGKRSALCFSFDKSGVAFRTNFCFLIFAFCLLLSSASAQERINLNTASAAELMRLPYVGQTAANRILEHRRKHGNFKRPQDIIIIKGLSAKRYRQIAHLIRI